MAPTKNVFIVGVTRPSPTAPFDVLEKGGDKEELQRHVTESFAKAAAAGYNLVVKQLDPVTFDQGVEEVKEMLRAQHWDGYIVGYGIRGDLGQTPTMEKLVNAGRQIIPNVPIGFNTRPDDVVETVERLFT